MSKEPIKQLPTFVRRTYRGGAMLGEFLGQRGACDSFRPEDWISSFTAAKNKDPIEHEGITRVLLGGREVLLTEAVDETDFGAGRTQSGLLIKFLDAAERLGIQVHPTKEYARKVFGSAYGKTECWHILNTRPTGEPAVVYLGFREHITKEIWRDLFMRQDIPGMLGAMHRFEVRAGDTVLVTGGTPHAIGAGCFLLELQEPSDYTMRAEKTTVSGEWLTPMQIHYGVGEETMLDCFDYTPRSRAETAERFFLRPRADAQNPDITHLVTDADTSCFQLDRIKTECTVLQKESFITVISVQNGGSLAFGETEYPLCRGDKFFIPAGTEIVLKNAEALVCYPPNENSREE